MNEFVSKQKNDCRSQVEKRLAPEGKVRADFNFALVIIENMGGLPFIPDPRYEDKKDLRYKVHEKIKGDVSSTHKAPYQSTSEIGLPRSKMNN